MADIKKKKKQMTTSTGKYKKKLHFNELGNTYLHKQKKIGVAQIGRSNLGRAIVYNQHIIDQLFLDKKISEFEHNACDKYLGLIHTSGTFGITDSSPREKIFTSHSFFQPPKSLILIKVQRVLRKSCGVENERMFWHIMTSEPKKLSKIEVLVLKKCSHALLNYWYIDTNSPVSLFQQAIANPV